MTRRNLGTMFRPSSIAVIGASPRPASPGNKVIRTLRGNGFDGRIVPVTSRHSSVEGLATIASPGALDEPVDLAVLLFGLCDGRLEVDVPHRRRVG